MGGSWEVRTRGGEASPYPSEEHTGALESTEVLRIRNREALVSHALSTLASRARGIALDAIEEALRSVDPGRLVKSRVTLTGDTLNVDAHIFDLSHFRRVLVIGGGKASGAMAEALEEILGDRIEGGVVVVPRGTGKRYRLRRIGLHEAPHPIPDEESVEAARRVMEMAGEAEEDDLVFCLISGGGSSLMTLPREGVTLNDKQRVTEMLLRSGATIDEINTVRKHLSGLKGGQLAGKIHPATLITLILSDVVGDRLDVIASGPMTPDPTTFQEAISILKRYGLWGEAPESVRKTLSKGARGEIPETPKVGDPSFRKVLNVLVGNNRIACSAALGALQRRGLKTLFLGSFVEGEARHLGFFLGALAREIRVSGNPLPPPVGVVVGGETTVRVTGGGTGGRNQEVTLGAALKIEGLDGVVVASISTDGIDGPTDAAGAIVDGDTAPRSRELGLDVREYLEENDSYTLLSRLDDLIYTGPTGTNVNDLSLLIVL